MEKLEIQKNLFDLSEEQEKMSKTIYSGKIIKCLVAPYHSYDELKDVITYTSTTYLFPEKELSLDKIKGLISTLVFSDKGEDEEILIITSHQNIILDMIDSSVRILTQNGDIVPCPVKTFLANIHDIRYSVLENKDHQNLKVSKKDKKESETKGIEIVNNLIDKVAHYEKDEKCIKASEYKKLKDKISLIGEQLIRNQMLSRLNSIKVVSDKSVKELEKDLKKAIDSEDYELAASIKKQIDER